MRWALAALCLVWAPLPAAAAARRAPAPLEPARHVFDEQLGSRWYGLYRDGHKVGWLRSSFSESTHRGAPSLVAEGHAVVTTRSAGREHQTEVHTVHRFEGAAPHRLIRYEHRSGRGDDEERRALQAGPGGSGWIATASRGAEGETVLPTDVGDYDLARFLAIETWIAGAPALGDTVRTVRLDGATLELSPGEVTVTGVQHSEIDAVPVTLYSVVSFGAGGSETTTRYDHEGRILSVEGGEVELRLEDEATASTPSEVRDLFIDSLVRPDGEGLPRGLTPQRMVIEIDGPGAAALAGGAGELTRAGGDPSADRWTLSVRAGQGAPITPEDEAAGRAPPDPTSEGRVARLVGQALPRRAHGRDAVTRLVVFVRDYLTDDRSAEPLDLGAVIDRRRGDCTEHAALFVAMARSAGFGAREVSGMRWVDGLGAFAGHAWAEVALDGRWVEVDPIWGQVPADAARLRLPEGASAQAAARRALRSSGLRVVSVE